MDDEMQLISLVNPDDTINRDPVDELEVAVLHSVAPLLYAWYLHAVGNGPVELSSEFIYLGERLSSMAAMALDAFEYFSPEQEEHIYHFFGEPGFVRERIFLIHTTNEEHGEVVLDEWQDVHDEIDRAIDYYEEVCKFIGLEEYVK